MTEQNPGEDTHARPTGEPGSGIDVVLVTGLSGAGRGTAAKVLEDLGWYVADNIPPELIEQCRRSSDNVRDLIARRVYPFDGSLYAWRPHGASQRASVDPGLDLPRR